MIGYSFSRSRLRARILCGLAGPALLSLAGGSFAAGPIPEKLPNPGAKIVTPALGHPVAPTVNTLNLIACRDLSLAKAPAIAAARASLAATQIRAAAVNKLCIVALIARDIPIRKQQACLGVTSSQGAVTQTEWDTVHGVTYCYVSALYASKQLRVALTATEQLRSLDSSLASLMETEEKDADEKKIADSPAYQKRRKRQESDRGKVQTYLHIAEARTQEALEGRKRALSALREAIGLCADDCIDIVDGEVLPADPPCLDEIVAAALARRGEMVQASIASTVTCLEVQAQRRTGALSARAFTFASGSDIHAREVPQGLHDETYRPGALGLEMPVLLPGKREARVEQAQAYHARTEAMVEKTKNLIVLEAEQAYLRWKEAKGKWASLDQAARLARDVFRSRWPSAKEAPMAGQRVDALENIDQVLSDGVLATDTRVQANLAQYQIWLNAASLERVTAGAYCPSWEVVGSQPDDEAPAKKKKAKKKSDD